MSIRNFAAEIHRLHDAGVRQITIAELISVQARRHYAQPTISVFLKREREAARCRATLTAPQPSPSVSHTCPQCGTEFITSDPAPERLVDLNRPAVAGDG